MIGGWEFIVILHVVDQKKISFALRKALERSLKADDHIKDHTHSQKS
jgi:hypothetical protein